MPSTTSSSNSRPLASSTVMTPSLPTFSIASAIFSPTMVSPLAAMLPTWPISFDPETGLERFLRSSTTLVTARSMPRLRSIGFMPAATDFMPSRTIDWARTVAVVVPSPAMSLVFDATSRSICAPIFSNLSSSSISLATVTPSLVTRGAPKLLSRTTLRPLGPRVTRTALARTSTPCSILSRASVENLTSLAAILVLPKLNDGRLRQALCGLPAGLGAFEHPHDVGLLHDEEFFAIDLHFCARPFAEQHPIARFEIDRKELAGFVTAARANGDNLALLGLFLGGVRNDNSALRFLFAFKAAKDDAVM